MIRTLAVMAAILTLGACQAESTDARGKTAAAARSETGEAECKAAGGTLVFGRAGPQCARPQPDAGKACRDNSECAGFCLAETRSCSPVTPFFGCHDVLTGSKTATVCVD